MRKGIFEDDDKKSSDDWNKALREEKKEAEENKEKQRVDHLWSDFKSCSSSKDTSQAKRKHSTGLGALCNLSSSKPPDKKPKNILSTLFDAEPEEKEIKEVKPKPKSLLSSLFDDKPKPPSEDASSSADQDTSTASSKIEITKVFDFAGESVKVTKHVDADSVEAHKYLKKKEEDDNKPITTNKKPGGLASVVGAIAKKPKMGCLDKSKLDWNKFVNDEGIKDELKTFNMGKDGFVEKQMFLERADLRQFEVEKAMREKNRKPLQR